MLDADSIDSARFERLLADGRRALQSGQPAEAARSLTTALASWRGPTFAGMADVPLIRHEAHRLEGLRLVARQERIDADLAQGPQQIGRERPAPSVGGACLVEGAQGPVVGGGDIGHEVLLGRHRRGEDEVSQAAAVDAGHLEGEAAP